MPLGDENTDVRADALIHGDNPAETITNDTSPTSFTFTAGNARDIHDSTDVTISNSTTASATEDITVELYEGIDTTGTLLDRDTQSVTVAAGGVTDPPKTFLTTNQGLGAGDYHIEIAQSGTALSIDQTDEHTLGAEFSTVEQDDGTLVTTDQQGRERARVDPVDNSVEYPGAVNASEGSFTSVDTEGLQTDSRLQPVQIRRDDAGTIYADGTDTILASGTDFSTVVNSAIDTLAGTRGGIVSIPAGEWVASSTIELHRAVILQGAGIESTVLQVPSGATHDLIRYSAPDGEEHYFAGVADMYLQGRADGRDGIRVEIEGPSSTTKANDFHIRNLFVHQFGNVGVNIDYGWGFHCDHVLIETCASHGLRLTGNQHYLSNMFIAYNQGNGIELNANRTKLSTVRIHNNDGRGLNAQSAHYPMFDGLQITNSGTGTGNIWEDVGLYVSSCRDPMIDNVWVGNTPNNSTQQVGVWATGADLAGGKLSGVTARDNTSDDIYLEADIEDLRLPNLAYDTITNDGARVVINGRVTAPETINMAGTSGAITPTALPVETLPVHVEGDSATAGAAVSLDGIDGVARDGQAVKLFHVGDDTITLSHNAAVTNPLINPGATNDTLDAGVAVYEYDGDSGHWLQTALNTAA